jgi:hypothetical protein
MSQTERRSNPEVDVEASALLPEVGASLPRITGRKSCRDAV